MNSFPILRNYINSLVPAALAASKSKGSAALNYATGSSTLELLRRLYEAGSESGENPLPGPEHASLLISMIPIFAHLFPTSFEEGDKFIATLLKNSDVWNLPDADRSQIFLGLLRYDLTSAFKALIEDPSKPIDWADKVGKVNVLYALTQTKHPGFLHFALKAGLSPTTLDEKGRTVLIQPMSWAHLDRLVKDPAMLPLLPQVLAEWKESKNVRNWDQRIESILPFLKQTHASAWPSLFEPLLERVCQSIESNVSLWKVLQNVAAHEKIIWPWPQSLSAQKMYEDQPLEVAVAHKALKELTEFKSKQAPSPAERLLPVLLMGDITQPEGVIWLAKDGDSLIPGVMPALLMWSKKDLQRNLSMDKMTGYAAKPNLFMQRFSKWMGGSPNQFWTDVSRVLDNLLPEKGWLETRVLYNLMYSKNWNLLPDFNLFQSKLDDRVISWMSRQHPIFVQSKKGQLGAENLQVLLKGVEIMAQRIQDAHQTAPVDLMPSMIELFGLGHLTPSKFSRLMDVCDSNHIQIPWTETLEEQFGAGLKFVIKNNKPTFMAWKMKQSLPVATISAPKARL